MIIKLMPTRVFRAYYGGENIDRLLGKDSAENGRFPEDWLGSVTTAFNPGREVENEGLTKTYDGDFLKDIIDNNREAMIGNRKNMSLLLKLLDAAERLVIQAHPTVEFAKEYFNSDFGKTECWYILNDGGYIYIGFKEGVTKEYWKSLFESQDTDKMLECLHRFDVKKGDFIFVPGGVPHAIGTGCFMVELQEPSDLMVIPERVTPSGVVLDEKKLHGGLGFEKMFDCFVYEGAAKDESKARYFRKPKHLCDGVDVIVDKSVTDKFSFVKLSVSDALSYEMPSYGICVVVSGEGEINGDKFYCGDRFFIPEAEGKLNITGNAEILLCMP